MLFLENHVGCYIGYKVEKSKLSSWRKIISFMYPIKNLLCSRLVIFNMNIAT